ncbi:MAG: hypothetical protein FJY20_03685 [Bacteroidetes bacterium]|nr:hypothetical protein [Bacteroidota bacterium]
MQTVRILQAVALMLIVALAASCSASKEYTSKLFAPRNPPVNDSQALALRFLDIDSTEKNTSDWVTTDIIMGRDTSGNSIALDNLAMIYPASPLAKPKSDSITVSKEIKEPLVKTTTPFIDKPVAKTSAANGVRQKKSRDE